MLGFGCKGGAAVFSRGGARLMLQPHPTTKMSKTSLKLLYTMRRTVPYWRGQHSTLLARYKSTGSPNTTTSSTSSKGTLYNLFTQERKHIGSITELCGHASSALVVIAYLNTDMLLLRTLSISSIIFGTAFRYYQPKPIWIPIKWGVLLLGINVYMVSELMMDRHRANNMPLDRKKLYDSGGFDERGFSKVQFMKFFDHGNRKVFSRGELITQQNREMDKLYYIIEGNATVKLSKDWRTLATIAPHSFIGEMAFLVYCQNSRSKDDQENICATASANVMADELVQVWEWDARTLADALKENRDLSNAFASYCSHDLRKKLLSANAEDGKELLEAKNFSKTSLLHIFTWNAAK